MSRRADRIAETAIADDFAQDDAHFRRLVDESLQGVLIHREWKPVYVNQAYARTLGYDTAGEVMALGSVERHLAPYERERRRTYMQARLRGEEAPAQYEFDAVRKDGSIVTLHNVVSVVQWHGKPAIQNTVMDVTERRRAEEALRWSEQRFRDFAETAADWFWELDADLHLSYLSDGHQQATGVGNQSLLGVGHWQWLESICCDPAGWRSFAARLESHDEIDAAKLELSAALGEARVHSLSGKPVFDRHGAFQGYRGSARDVSRSHRMAQQLSHQATHDPLTGLVNRREFELRLGRALASVRDGGPEHALCYLDLDEFKIVNDTCGHLAGDQLLKQVSALLSAQVRETDTLARLGGDEFAVLLERCSLDQAEHIAAGLREAMGRFRFVWEGARFGIGVTVGLVPVTGIVGSVSEMLSAADNACYLAKERGRNRVHVCRADDLDLTRRRQEAHSLTRISIALDANQLSLEYQPIVSLLDEGRATRALAAPRIELLPCMHDGNGERVPRREFLPAADRYQIAPRIDLWLIENGLAWLAAESERLEELDTCFIDLSPSAMRDPDFVDFAAELVDASSVPAERICFQIAEKALTGPPPAGARRIDVLRERGCRFALKSFGSGLATYATLERLPVDYLKLDADVVRIAASSAVARTLVETSASIARLTGKRVIAPGVDAESTRQMLRAAGIDYLQGELSGPPRDAAPS